MIEHNNHKATIDHTLSGPYVNQLEGFLTKIRETGFIGQKIKSIVWYQNGRIQIELEEAD